MTEAEWLECSDPTPMLGYLRCNASDRKMRLLACAYCRRIWHLLSDGRCRQAIEVAEDFADGRREARELDQANAASYSVYANTSSPESGFANAAVGISRSGWEGAQAATVAAMAYTAPEDGYLSASAAAEQAALAAAYSAGAVEDIRNLAETMERRVQAGLLREIFNNPFSPSGIHLERVTSAIKILAQGIYEAQIFDRLPILADALEEAGCTNADILAHCRGPGPHVRGCWVVDLILGKS